ncbi:MAG: alpha/beta hydrolase [Sciscionella sp.]
MARTYRRYVRPFSDRFTPRGPRLLATRRFTDSGGLVRLPRGTRVWKARYGPIRGVWIQARHASSRNGLLVHLHGGGFVFGSARSHRGMAYALSSASGMPTFLPEYRLAPRHPFPAAADDCLAAYRALIDHNVTGGRIRLSGDSAGGHLVCGLLGDIRRHGLPMPAATALFSPMLDLRCTEVVERDLACDDPFISPSAAFASAAAYAGTTPLDDPRLDVLNADKAEWPRTLIQTGELECLLGDSERLAKSLDAAGVACELQVWPGQMHVFQAFDFIPESRAAIRYTGDFLRG